MGRGWDLQGTVYSTQTTVWQPSKMLITINRQKDSRDFSPHYFSWSSRDSGSWKIWISKLEKQASTHGFKKILFLDITRPYNFRKSEKLLKFYQWKAKATSKALKFTVNRQKWKKFTVNRQSYHPTETVSVTLERVTHGIKFLTIKFMREGLWNCFDWTMEVFYTFFIYKNHNNMNQTMITVS